MPSRCDVFGVALLINLSSDVSCLAYGVVFFFFFAGQQMYDEKRLASEAQSFSFYSGGTALSVLVLFHSLYK